MARGRKTFEVAVMLETVNRRNRESVVDPSVRRGWNSLLETILHETNSYAGFGYYEAKDVPVGELPGIERNPDGTARSFPDETRRFYYTKFARTPDHLSVVRSEAR